MSCSFQQLSLCILVHGRERSNVKKKALLIVLAVFFLLVVIMKLIALIEKDFDVLLAFLFPTALAPMLVKLLTNERLAFMTTIITAATAGVMLQEGYAAIIQMEVALYILFGGITSLYLLGNSGQTFCHITDEHGCFCRKYFVYRILLTYDTVIL